MSTKPGAAVQLGERAEAEQPPRLALDVDRRIDRHAQPHDVRKLLLQRARSRRCTARRFAGPRCAVVGTTLISRNRFAAAASR